MLYRADTNLRRICAGKYKLEIQLFGAQLLEHKQKPGAEPK